MNLKNHFIKVTICALLLFAGTSFSRAQTAKLPEPKQDKLLNGLKLLDWYAPNAEKVTAKLRIHSGSAFDRQDREGTAAMLTEILFPDETTKEFFRDDLGGSFDIESNYDYIQINVTVDSDKFLTMLETIANAVASPQIDKETTAKARAAQLKKVKELEKNPSYVADRAAAENLLGVFPYGRAQAGTSESLQKVDYADLIFFKQRFLTADNATLAIVGNVKPDLVYRAVRRYFGAWEKSDKKIPATFTQPAAPKHNMDVINLPTAERAEFRTAARGLARNDKDFGAAQILAGIMQENWSAFQPENSKQNAFVENQAHFLPGIFIIKTSVSPTEIDAFMKKLETGGKILNTLTTAEFEKAKAAEINDFNAKTADLNSLAEMWLDIDTYKLLPVREQSRAMQNVSFDDVKRIHDKLFVQSPKVTVVVLKQEIEPEQTK